MSVAVVKDLPECSGNKFSLPALTLETLAEEPGKCKYDRLIQGDPSREALRMTEF